MRAVTGIAAVLILAAVLATPALAGGVHWSIGLNLAAPVYYHPYWGYPYPYYYYRPYPVYVTPPPVVVEPGPVYQAVPVVRPVYSSPAEAAQPTQAAQPAAWASDAAGSQLQQLNNADDHVRADAAVQLGRLKATRAVQPLTQVLNADRSASVREAAARGLGLIGSADALPALQRAAQADEDRDVRHSAQFAAEVIRSNLPH
jgi:hypothetical protein